MHRLAVAENNWSFKPFSLDNQFFPMVTKQFELKNIAEKKVPFSMFGQIHTLSINN